MGKAKKRKLVPMPPGIHAGKLHKEARSYVEASRKLTEDPNRLIGPRYFLLCHGLELALKAFLAAKGDRWAILTNLGHDLSAAYERAQSEYGLKPSNPLLDFLVEEMSPQHKEQLFRYPGTIWLNLPRSDQCCDVIDELLDQISGAVEVARSRTTLRLLSGKSAPDRGRVKTLLRACG